MTNPVLRVRQRLAYALRQMSYFVGPRPVTPPGTPTTLAELEAASAHTDRMVNEILVRGYLQQALGRYQPIRLPGQA